MSGWKSDRRLRDRLYDLVKSSYKQKEILHCVAEEFSGYKWSLRTLQRRLEFFKLQRNDPNLDPRVLVSVVKTEIDGPGGLLGIKSMHRKVRNDHNLLAKRQDVYLAMNLIAPEKLEQRRLTKDRKMFKRRQFKSEGPNATWSLDGHDKLSGRHKSEFPFGIHGCIDAFSRKILWLKVWPSNCNPDVPAKLFVDAVSEFGYVPARTRSDRGGENVVVAAYQDFLTDAPANMSNHTYGPSTTNQVIEQWWKGFRERHGEYFKEEIHQLVSEGYYDETNSTCRVILAYVFIPLIQEALDSFVSNWNTHRIRKQKIYRPCGIPNFLYAYPTENGGKQCGLIPSQEDLFYLQKKTRGLKNWKFVDPELESSIEKILVEHGIRKISLAEAKDVYIILMDAFADQDLEFSYS